MNDEKAFVLHKCDTQDEANRAKEWCEDVLDLDSVQAVRHPKNKEKWLVVTKFRGEYEKYRMNSDEIEPTITFGEEGTEVDDYPWNEE